MLETRHLVEITGGDQILLDDREAGDEKLLNTAARRGHPRHEAAGGIGVEGDLCQKVCELVGRRLKAGRGGVRAVGVTRISDKPTSKSVLVMVWAPT